MIVDTVLNNMISEDEISMAKIWPLSYFEKGAEKFHFEEELKINDGRVLIASSVNPDSKRIFLIPESGKVYLFEGDPREDNKLLFNTSLMAFFNSVNAYELMIKELYSRQKFKKFRVAEIDIKFIAKDLFLKLDPSGYEESVWKQIVDDLP